MPNEFWTMSFAEVEAACKGYEKRMAKLMEVPRLIATILHNVNRGKNPPRRPSDIYPLYTDKDRQVQLMTLEEYEAAKELFKDVTWQSRN